VVDGVIHYCSPTCPARFPRTSTLALTNATAPYVRALATWVAGGLQARPGLAAGLNVHAGNYARGGREGSGPDGAPGHRPLGRRAVAPVWRDRTPTKGGGSVRAVPLGLRGALLHLRSSP